MIIIEAHFDNRSFEKYTEWRNPGMVMNIYLYLLIAGACIAKWLESFKVARNMYYS